MKNNLATKIIATMVVLVIPLGFFFYWAVFNKPTQVKPLPVGNAIGYYKFVDQQGDSISTDDLKGYIYVADFFYTSCPGFCPRMSERMAKILAEKDENGGLLFMEGKDAKKFKLVSFSVDPAHDSVPVLRQYANQYKAVNNKWLFLTGDKKSIYKLCQKDFQLGLSGDSTAITHSDRWMLVDDAGRVRGNYKVMDNEIGQQEYERLMNDIQNLFVEDPNVKLKPLPNG